MEAIKITAHLMSGFCANDRYTPSIDGIIAYALRKSQLTDEQFALDTAQYHSLPPVDDLPVQKEIFDDQWWYQCSFPIYHDHAVLPRYIHRRFNSMEAESLAPGVKKIETTKGAYKNSRIMLNYHITNSVSWHVVGLRDEIKLLLDTHITHIGKRVSAGFGKVRRWEIESGDAEKARFQRALPKEFAEQNGIEGIIMQCGIIPPANIKQNQELCVMSLP